MPPGDAQPTRCCPGSVHRVAAAVLRHLETGGAGPPQTGRPPPRVRAAAADVRPWAPLVAAGPGAAATLCAEHGDPLALLAAGAVPAIVLRGALPAAVCRALTGQMAAAGLYPQAWLPLLDLPPGTKPGPTAASVRGHDGWRLDYPPNDLGGWMGSKSQYFDWSAEQHSDAKWAALGGLEPMSTMRAALGALSNGRQRGVRAAEPVPGGGARRYGLANVRAHQPGGGHSPGQGNAPHFDSLRYREVRPQYAVFEYGTQLGGVVMLQPPDEPGRDFGCRAEAAGYHDALFYDVDVRACDKFETGGRPALRTAGGDELMFDTANSTHGRRNPVDGSAFEGPHFHFMLDTEGFAAYRESRRPAVREAAVDLSAGDMYFFKSDSVHAVPGFSGGRARVVMGAFIGYDAARPEIAVWS
jgi:hypothetical protein